MDKRFVVALAALIASFAAAAGLIHVKPTTLVMSPGQSAAVLTVTNNGDKPITAQVRVFGWDQVGGKDDLQSTRKVVASPPMATLAPKSSQSIRVVRVSKEPVAGEESYRLLVDEIIDPATAPKVGVAVQMRYSVPVFVESAEGKPASVAVTAEMAGNSLRIKAVNSGGMFAQAADVSLEYAGGISTPVADGLLGYVLPGKTMQWALDVPGNAAASGKPVRMNAKFNGEPFQVDL